MTRLVARKEWNPESSDWTLRCGGEQGRGGGQDAQGLLVEAGIVEWSGDNLDASIVGSRRVSIEVVPSIGRLSVIRPFV